jgi:hypothetical protein
MESEQVMLPGWALAQQSYSPTDGAASEKEEGERTGKPRFQQIDREQLFWRMVNVERLIAEDHGARAIWEFVGKLDLSGYSGEVHAVEGYGGAACAQSSAIG